MSSTAVNLNRVGFLLITGASRGIGKAMAIGCAKELKPGSLILLLARSAAGLEATKTEILACNDKITIVTASVDLTESSRENLEVIVDKALANGSRKDFDFSLVIHNVGTLGDVTKWSRDLNSQAIWREHFSVNVFSIAVLNSVFLDKITSTDRIVVNVTSLAAVEPFPSMGLYCSSRAARQMYFRCLAAENPNIVVLNYSPGPVDTDMQTDIRTNAIAASVKDYMGNLHKEGKLVTLEQTTQKFLEVLREGKFKSGDRIDYYD
ncbi:Sepiapterin reductase [Sergentomyia squamirostris]